MIDPLAAKVLLNAHRRHPQTDINSRREKAERRRIKNERAAIGRKASKEARDGRAKWPGDEELQKEREASANVKIRLTREDIMGQHGQGF